MFGTSPIKDDGWAGTSPFTVQSRVSEKPRSRRGRHNARTLKARLEKMSEDDLEARLEMARIYLWDHQTECHRCLERGDCASYLKLEVMVFDLEDDVRVNEDLLREERDEHVTSSLGIALLKALPCGTCWETYDYCRCDFS